MPAYNPYQTGGQQPQGQQAGGGTFQPQGFQNTQQFLSGQNQQGAQNFTPSSFDYGGFQNWAAQDVNYTPETIQNMYQPAFNKLENQFGMQKQGILDTLKSRGLGRSGEVETSLGDLSAQTTQQMSDVMSNIMSSIIPQQEQLTQQRKGMGLGAEAQQQQTAQQAMRDTFSQNMSERQTVQNELNSAAQRATEASSRALAEGNFQLYAKYQGEMSDINKRKMQLEEQGQTWGQGVDQAQMMQQMLGTLFGQDLGKESNYYDLLKSMY